MTTAFVPLTSPNGFATAAVVHAAAHQARRQAAIRYADHVIDQLAADLGHHADWMFEYWTHLYECYAPETPAQPEPEQESEPCPF
jgi:hypothetical protein